MTKNFWFWPVAFLGLLSTACRTAELSQDPPVSPADWCRTRPCIEVGSLVFTEPLGSALVFLLAGLWVASGIYFLRDNPKDRSRLWFGVALVLGGLGAAQAGISYQAFGYELKCAGRANCLLTNWLEIGYSLTQAISVSAMTAALAYACLAGGWRRILLGYSLLNAFVYIVTTTFGVILPSRVLLSFEVLMLFALPGILLVLTLAGIRYRRSRSELDGALFMAAFWLIVVQVAYFAYAAAGLTATLYRQGAGFYFSENDVLHVGMIAWLGYVVRRVGPRLRDRA